METRIYSGISKKIFNPSITYLNIWVLILTVKFHFISKRLKAFLN
jgi:hypothetical protein